MSATWIFPNHLDCQGHAGLWDFFVSKPCSTSGGETQSRGWFLGVTQVFQLPLIWIPGFADQCPESSLYAVPGLLRGCLINECVLHWTLIGTLGLALGSEALGGILALMSKSLDQVLWLLQASIFIICYVGMCHLNCRNIYAMSVQMVNTRKPYWYS